MYNANSLEANDSLVCTHLTKENIICWFAQHCILSKNRERYSIATQTLSVHKKENLNFLIVGYLTETKIFSLSNKKIFFIADGIEITLTFAWLNDCNIKMS